MDKTNIKTNIINRLINLSPLIYSFLYKITNLEINKTKDINSHLIQSNKKVITKDIEWSLKSSHSKK